MTAMSYVVGTTDTPLLHQTIGHALRRAARDRGGRPALTSLFQGAEFDYAALDRAVDRVAKGLLAAGVKPGERVAIWSANRWEWLVAHHGAVRMGAVLVPINPAFRSDEARYILDDAGATLLFAAPGFRDWSYVDAIAEARKGLPGLHTVVLFGEDAPEGMTDWEGFLSAGDRVPDAELERVEAAADPAEPCNLQYTSGTTGRPKGALLTHANILNNGYFVGIRQRLGPEDSICLPVPFFHCFGNVLGALAALTHGSELVLPGEGFEPEATLRAVAERRCTSLYGVPMMFIAMLGHDALGRLDLSSLRTGCIGAAPCPETTMKGIVERMNMRQITVVYGMTETSPISYQSLPDDPEEVRCSTVGAIQPHLESKIVDPATGTTVPRGQVGELCVRGYSVMKGYWQRPEETAAAIDGDGYMHSGDLAVMREDGYVQIVGRLKDTVIRGGENIYPREIEEFLMTLDGVSEAYVFGVPDDKYGEEVCAWIRTTPGTQLDGEELRARCKGLIATYKIPRYVRVVDDFPATASGKVQRFRMRETEMAERGMA